MLLVYISTFHIDEGPSALRKRLDLRERKDVTTSPIGSTTLHNVHVPVGGGTYK